MPNTDHGANGHDASSESNIQPCTTARYQDNVHLSAKVIMEQKEAIHPENFMPIEDQHAASSEDQQHNHIE